MTEEKKTSSSKINFLLGFFAGLAVISVIGFLVLLGLMFSNREAVDLTVAASDEAQVVADDTQEVAASPVRPISEDDNYKGDLSAPIQFIIYDDFECPYCLRHEDTLKQLEAEYGNKIVWAYRHFPLGFHEHAQKAAEASECAAEQGKFWEMHDLLFVNQGAGTLGVDQFITNAKTLGLNVANFTDCLNSGKYAGKVAQDLADGVEFGVQGTPGNFINGNAISGALPFEQFKVIIDQLLAQ